MDVVFAVTHDQSEPFSASHRGSHWLDLKTLQDGNGEHFGGFVGVIEDHAGSSSRFVRQFVNPPKPFASEKGKGGKENSLK